MTYKEIARAIADSYAPPQSSGNGSLVCYWGADGTQVANTDEAQFMSRYNPLTKRLKVLLYPHHDTIGLFYLGDD